MKSFVFILALLVGGCASPSVTVEAPALSPQCALEGLSGSYTFVGIIRRHMWQRDVPASIFESFPKFSEFPEGVTSEVFHVGIPDPDTIILSSCVNGAERRRIFKRGIDFQFEGVTPIFAIPDFLVRTEGSHGKCSGYARLFRTVDGALAVRFDLTFQMVAVFVPYTDHEQAWAIFGKKEPNQALEHNDRSCHASCGARVAPAAVVAHL